MLIIHDIIEPIDPYERQLDFYTQKVIRAVKTFLNQVMPDKSNITESKDESQNKKVKLVKRMIYELFDEVVHIEQSTYDGKPLLTIYFKSDSNAANITSWFTEHISDEIKEITSGNVVVCPSWAFYWDPRIKNADVFITSKKLK